MNFNIFNSIILAGVIQGLIFGAVVLWSKKYRRNSVFFLTAIIVIYSLSNLQFYLADIKFLTLDELYTRFHIPWGNTIPALLYFYVITFLDSKRKITSTEKLLLVPFIISFLISVFYKIAHANQWDDSYENGLRTYLESYDELISAIFHIIILCVLLIKISIYLKTNEDFKYDHIKLHLNWLRITLIVLLILIPLWISLTALDLYYPGEISFYPLWLAMAGLIYWLGHIGIYKFGIVQQRKQIRKKKSQKESTLVKGKTKHIIIERLKAYLVDEKRFLDADLTLEKTAQALELSQGHLSKIINTELEVSFKDYINTLRVEEAKSYLLDTDFSNYTLVAIGLEAGFNSKSAFNSSFKKITGETPSQFKRKHIN